VRKKKWNSVYRDRIDFPAARNEEQQKRKNGRGNKKGKLELNIPYDLLTILFLLILLEKSKMYSYNCVVGFTAEKWSKRIYTPGIEIRGDFPPLSVTAEHEYSISKLSKRYLKFFSLPHIYMKRN
jgi:hypothetical protein